MNQFQHSRIFGLDLMRSLAILLVVFAHSSYLLESSTLFPFISLPDGVDLFFVLSGFLIGKILIDIFVSDEDYTSKSIWRFLKRRWFRTLPNYFLFLLINISLIKFELIKGFINKYLITYFFFLQNFHKPYDFLFWESWSLSVEEWFYLLFPVNLFLLFFIFKNKIKREKLFLIGVLSFILFPLLYRLVQLSNANDFDLYTRKLVLTRLDTIGYGLLMAYFFKFHWEKFLQFKTSLFIVGITSLFILVNLEKSNDFFHLTFYYSCIGIAIAITLPFFNSLKNENIPLKPFQFISIISYSVYLVHMPLLHILTEQFKNWNPLIVYSLFWILTFVISFIIYKFYERPMTKLRERF